MATNGFHISEVRFRGENVEDAVVLFSTGLSVVVGPSNTGKSLIQRAINFVFGSSDGMKSIKEAAAYRKILVEIQTAQKVTWTFERAWQGGDVRQYQLAARDVNEASVGVDLSWKHSPDDTANISRVLLALSGLDAIKLRKNQKGATRNLSFRDLVEYVLVSEGRIIDELSPIHTASYTDRTLESSLFRILLTGQDDKNIIVAQPPIDPKATAAGRGIVFDRLRSELNTRIEKTGRSEADVRSAAASIDSSIEKQSKLLQTYRTDLNDLEKRRRDLSQERDRARARLTQIEGNLERFKLLNKQYASDLNRLQSNLEAGTLLAEIEEGICPVCGAEPENHKQHSISQEQIDEYTTASSAEADKIQLRQGDLASTMQQLESEAKLLRSSIAKTERDRSEAEKALRAVLEPNIAGLDRGLSEMVNERQELERAIGLFDELKRLDQTEKGLESSNVPKKGKKTEFAGLPPNAYDEFAKAVEALLREWSYPELDRVVFDPLVEDIVISGKARKDNGKGYRAITYAAFMIALLRETLRKDLPHPGFIMLDSPLVTYREPDEHIGEGVKAAFYKSLAATLGLSQVIILENIEPPKELHDSIALTQFTKNPSVGRYGLFPHVPDE